MYCTDMKRFVLRLSQRGTHVLPPVLRTTAGCTAQHLAIALQPFKVQSAPAQLVLCAPGHVHVLVPLAHTRQAAHALKRLRLGRSHRVARRGAAAGGARARPGVGAGAGAGACAGAGTRAAAVLVPTPVPRAGAGAAGGAGAGAGALPPHRAPAVPVWWGLAGWGLGDGEPQPTLELRPLGVYRRNDALGTVQGASDARWRLLKSTEQGCQAGRQW